MLSLPAAIVIAVGTLMVITIIVTLLTGSVLASGVVLVLIALLGIVLVRYGFLQVGLVNNEVDVRLFESPLAVPTAPIQQLQRAVPDKEVFHVSDEKFTYEDAPAVCAAYNAELASQEQIEEAYAGGAEWCGYGWSAGGLGLFPTQKATWELLQREVDPQKRMSCGRPGVNGGYFDPTLKFGVNCYGKKPAGSVTLPLPPPGVDMVGFNQQVQYFKDQIGSFFLDPFNRSTWSTHGGSGSYGTQFEQKSSSPYVFQAVENPVAGK